jgi:hydroxymethylbilane synthase
MTAERPLIAGTRGSVLALNQTALVVEALLAAHLGLAIDTVEVRTEGDRDRNTPLSVLGGKGIFVKELELALLDGRIDFAVHSLKDVPSSLPPGLVLTAITRRADARDALVSRNGATLSELPPRARVGTGSRRRRAELLQLRPDVVLIEVRGNVDTRIRHMREGGADAVVLAAAGLERLGRLGEAAQIFSADELLPAIGQGALAVETRADDERTRGLLAAVDDAETHTCTLAERAFLRRLGGGCLTPAAAYCVVEAEGLYLRGLVAGEDNSVLRDATRGREDEPEALGEALADALAARGALDLIARSG